MFAVIERFTACRVEIRRFNSQMLVHRQQILPFYDVARHGLLLWNLRAPLSFRCGRSAASPSGEVVEGLLYGLLPGQAVAWTGGKLLECLGQRADGRFRKHDPAGLAIDPAGCDRLEEQFLAEVDHVTCRSCQCSRCGPWRRISSARNGCICS